MCGNCIIIISTMYNPMIITVLYANELYDVVIIDHKSKFTVLSLRKIQFYISGQYHAEVADTAVCTPDFAVLSRGYSHMGYSQLGYSQFVYSTSFYLNSSKTDKKVIIVLVFTNISVRSCQ